MKLALISLSDDSKKQVNAFAALEGLEPRGDLISRVIHWQMARRRSGTSVMKTRGQLSYSTRKIYRQKGTGGARHGARSANLFRGGARSFGPRRRDYGYALNKNIRKLGLAHALADKLKSKSVFLLASQHLTGSQKEADAQDLAKPMTTLLKKKLGELKLDRALVVAPKDALPNMRLAAANLAGIDFIPPDGANVYDIVNHRQIIIWQNSLKELENRIALSGNRASRKEADKTTATDAGESVKSPIQKTKTESKTKSKPPEAKTTSKASKMSASGATSS